MIRAMRFAIVVLLITATSVAAADRTPPWTVRSVAADQVGRDARIVAGLPWGRVLVVVPPTAEDRGSPWSLDRAVTPTLRRLATAKSRVGEVPMVIGLAPGAQVDAVAAAMEDAGADVAWRAEVPTGTQLGLRVPSLRLAGVIDTLPPFEGSVVVADAQWGARLQNNRSAPLCQSGTLISTPVFDHGLHGENQVVALMDTGIDPDSCFFVDHDRGLPALNDSEGIDVDLSQRKLLAVDFWWDEEWPDPGPADWDTQSHGTHTAGSAAGDADRIGVHDGFDGMAPAARLVIQDGGYEIDDCADLPGLGCPVVPLDRMLAQAWEQGARIHSNSWGDEEEILPFGRYTLRTADVDTFVREHPEMVVVAAAGNAGQLGDDTVISPSIGKNVISVGAISEADDPPVCPSYFSSRGWSRDGRIKPDVMAPGSAVISAATDLLANTETCSVSAKSGTSMATPTVAGLAALVRQYFVEGWQVAGVADAGRGFEPTAALVKAVLIASAVDLNTLGCHEVDRIPSRGQGWGLVQVGRALWFRGDDHRLWAVDERGGFTSAGEVWIGKFAVDRPAALKIVLNWLDPPSTPDASRNLVNDLDLEVEGPEGLYRGNVFVQGASVIGGTADHRNNVEVVWLPDAAPGSWTIRVRADEITIGPQGFALVIVGDDGAEFVPAPRNPGSGGRSGP